MPEQEQLPYVEVKQCLQTGLAAIAQQMETLKTLKVEAPGILSVWEDTLQPFASLKQSALNIQSNYEIPIS
ncbi:hypothetical protein H6F90_23600 [Trichocoleus sp. FACHB-591]|uniref:hypothetical protein n=1 Tax=Trichocoleus sp. FACHB-591 TaxID=2692872 RepID=UPI001685B298|nr:hypothetical protein [Trichocoleus sp. FACHB-591]MBD2098061.1 hypothetical protein [Trichocoleus sp. FACHB-591]